MSNKPEEKNKPTGSTAPANKSAAIVEKKQPALVTFERPSCPGCMGWNVPVIKTRKGTSTRKCSDCGKVFDWAEKE